MEDFLLILMALCGVLSQALSYDNWGYFPLSLDSHSGKRSEKTYFKNPRFFPSSLTDHQQQEQQLDRRSLPAAAYFPDDSREEIKLWWDNVMEQRRLYDEIDQDYKEEPRFNFGGDLDDASKEYVDFFGLNPPSEALKEDEAFRRALKTYLSQGNQNFIPRTQDVRFLHEQRQESLAVPHLVHNDLTKTIASESMKLPSTTVSPAPPTMTTRSTQKGQKEFAMLRPPSDNHRQFDKWAKSFQDSVINSAAAKIRETRQTIPNSKTAPDDNLLQQLRSLKKKSAKKNF